MELFHGLLKTKDSLDSCEDCLQSDFIWFILIDGMDYVHLLSMTRETHFWYSMRSIFKFECSCFNLRMQISLGICNFTSFHWKINFEPENWARTILYEIGKTLFKTVIFSHFKWYRLIQHGRIIPDNINLQSAYQLASLNHVI